MHTTHSLVGSFTHQHAVVRAPQHLSAATRRQFVARSSTRTTEGRSLEAVLQEEVGIEPSVLGSWRQRAPELSCVSVQERVEPLLAFLQSDTLQLAPSDLRVMLLRCPRLLSFSTQRQVAPVVAFLRDDPLGFNDQQVASTLKRFPGIMGYGVKSHLVPHCHYLKSLGLSDEELRQLVLTRPQVLGTSIELVITYLRKWLRVERTLVGRLLWSYPLDYSLPRLVMPTDTTPAADTSLEDEDGIIGEKEGQEQEGAEEEGRGSSSSKSEGVGTPAPPPPPAASAASSSGSTVDGGGQQEQQPQEGRKKSDKKGGAPLWGCAEACSWLDIDLRKSPGSSNSSGSDDGEEGSGGSSKGSNPNTSPDSPSNGGAGGEGSGSQPPSAA